MLSHTHTTAILWLSFLFCTNTINAQPNISIEPYASGFTRPVKVTHAYDSRLFIAEIGGKIKILKNGVVLHDSPFLDIGGKIKDPQWAGIYSIVFHPNYQKNGYFYVMYVVKDTPTEQKFEVQISRFSRAGGADSDVADPTETPILTIPYTDVLGGHRGGDMAFDSHNQLYISTGDNGPGSRNLPGDPDNNAQNQNNIFGKLLKINPENPPTTTEAINNIWALGLRNPWRFSFDRSTGDLWLGDNGHDGWEEINFLTAGNTNLPRNFGWDFMEGNSIYKDCSCDIATTFIAPKLAYPGYNNNGHVSASVMGGYVYRGTQFPSLTGTYFYGDYQSFKIGAITPSGYQGFTPSVSYPSVIGFGEDKAGELYVLSFLDGTLGKITLPFDPLPVKLLNFTAKIRGSFVLLEWETSDAINFSHFEIERSRDGRNFDKITNSPTRLRRFLDEHPFPGNNVYRLKMVDNDGTFQYSRLVVAKDLFENAMPTVFPNPSSENFIVNGLKPNDEINVYKRSGLLIMSSQVLTSEPFLLNLKNRPTGMYLINIKDSSTGVVKKLTLVKHE